MNVFSFTHYMAARVFAAIALFSLVAGMLPMQAQAVVNPNNDAKIKICHATPNGYDNGKKEVSQNSILENGGHNSHTTGGYNNTGDIIPPFGNYAGKNWSEPYITIYNGNCNTKGDVTVTKIVNGGTAVVSDFSLFVGNTSVISGTKKNGILMGDYKVTETGPANYAASFSGACDSDGDITILPDKSISCTITNTYVPPPCPEGTTGPGVPNCTPIPPPPIPCPPGTTGDFEPNCTPIPPPPTCNDQIMNGNETGVDSGGDCTPPPIPCPPGTTGDFEPNCTPIPPPPVPCPTGFTGTSMPNCTPIPPPPIPCPNGTTGTYPNCTVIPPTPSCQDGLQNQGETGIDIGGPCVGGGDATQLCEVVIVSDASDFVVEKNANAFALVTPYLHSAWTLLSGASWIWGDSQVVDPTIDETQTFKKQFGFVGNVTSATLTLASDNSHVATLNVGTGGTPHVGALENNFSSSVVYDVTADVGNGNNELVVSVKNWKLDGSTPASNPAGLLYKLVILAEVTSNSDCLTPYVPPVVDVCPNLAKDQATVPPGYVLDGQGQCVPVVLPACEIGENLLVNGSFEDPVADANPYGAGFWEIFPGSIPGWSVSLSSGLELWNNMFGGASDGVQNAELDGDDATRITQTVATTPGATYELRFDFAARTADATDNSIDVAIDGASILATSTANTNWRTYSKTFVADGSTDIAFTDLGIAQDLGGTGTLLDNAVLCFVRNGEGGKRTDEDELSCEITASDLTPRRGSDVTLNWTSIGAASASLDGDTVDTSDSLLIENLGEDTTYTLTVYGEGEEPDSATCSVTVDTHGGGGGHHNDNDDEPDGEVLGASDSNVSNEPEPKGLVLGEQVSAVPTGAPDTGKGGTAETLVMGRLLVAPRRIRIS